MAGTFLEASLWGSLKKREDERHTRRTSIIPSLVDLSLPMHRSRGRLSRPLPVKGRRRNTRAPSMPDAASVAVRHSPRLSAASAASGSNLASSPRESNDEGDVSPPPPRYLCDWAQAIICEYHNLKPMPCQKEGCDTVVHHLCQSAWERREGYDDTVARYCCRHHPDYKYRSAPPKEDMSVASAQDGNVESQLTEADDDDGDGGEKDDHDDAASSLCGLDASVDIPSFDITDYTANEYDVNERTAHYMERRPISAANRCAVEAVYMVEALTLVKSMRTMRRQEIAERVQDKYKSFIRSIPIDRFSDCALRAMMLEKYFRAKGTSADGLLTKATDVLKNVRAMAAMVRGVSTPLHQIPSGRSLIDMRNEFILTKWSAAQGFVYVPSNNDEQLMSEVPDGWWLANPTTHLLLAVLVHRCNPDVIVDPTTVSTGPTRETLRKENRKDTVERRERDKIIEVHGSNRQLAEESMLASKAQLMAQTVDSGTIDQVKEQLSLLAQFKDSYVKVQNRINGQGEDDYDQTAHDLLSELPFLKRRRVDGNGSIIATSSSVVDSPMTNGNM